MVNEVKEFETEWFPGKFVWIWFIIIIILICSLFKRPC